MSDPRKLQFTLLAIALVLVGMFSGYKLKQSLPDFRQTDYNESLNKFQDALRMVDYAYIEPVTFEKMVDDAIAGLLEGLDPHSFYIPKQEKKGMDEQMAGSFEGIGVEFNILEDTIYVVAPISGGPSERIGILAGDRIVEIDSQTVAGVGITNADVMSKLKGKKGTIVKVGIKRRGINRILPFDIVRDKIPFYSVDYAYMMDEKTGYLKLSRFAETTFQEFTDNIKTLKASGMQNLILDLRSNPGGYMNMAQLLSDEFLPEGKLVVYTEGRTVESKSRYISTGGVGEFEKGGLIILIDQGSASASEIVSGAVQDWDRGLVLGTRSFGKGLVQTQHNFPDGSAMRLVISKYFTPSGRCIQKPYDKSSKAYNSELNERYEAGEFFDESKIKFPDSLKFKTGSGRIVYGGGGIMPDVFIPIDTSGTSPLYTDLLINGVFNQFGLKYADAHPELKQQFTSGIEFAKKFQLSDEMLKEFQQYAGDKKIKWAEKDFIAAQKRIRMLIKANIGRRIWNDEGFYPVIHQEDTNVIQALKLMPEAIKLAETGKFERKK
jgi:carboxyl-terminal processing protease